MKQVSVPDHKQVTCKAYNGQLLRNVTRILLALGIQACSSSGSETGPIGVPTDLLPYYEAFQDAMDERGFPQKAVRVPSKFEKLGEDKIGYCRAGVDFRYLAFDPIYWKKASNPEREVLVFHELGHCVLGLDHFDGLDKFGMPVSIMISSMNLGSFRLYTQNRSSYINQLLDMFQNRLK